MQRLQSTAGTVLLRAAALIPACLTLACIAAFAVNVPWLEEWDYVLLFQKLANGDLSWRDLFAFYNEYRQFFPNLLFLLLGRISGGDVRLGMLVSLLLACLVSFNVYRLARQHKAPSLLATYLAANVLIFSPMQYENWLQGQQLIYFVPIACLSTALVIARSPEVGTPTRFASGALLSTVSTFSSANGLLCWLLLLPALLRPRSRSEAKTPTRWTVGWLAAAALNVVVYFESYRNAPLRQVSSTVSQPQSAIAFFFTVLGAPLGLERTWLAAPVGIILLATFGWICWRVWTSRHDPPSTAIIAWLVIGGYSILTAVLITIGRLGWLGFGLELAVASRYTTFTLYLAVSLVFLIPTMLATRATRFGGPLGTLRPATVVAVVVLVIHVPLYRVGIVGMSAWHQRALSSKACVLLANVVRDECPKMIAYHSFDGVRERATVAEKLGYLDGRMLESDDIQEVADGRRGAWYGSFDSLVHQGGDRYVASGEAYLPHGDSPAHLVVLTYRDAGGRDKVFAVSGVLGDRNIILAALGRASYRGGGWRKPFATGALPASPVLLKAWAFDAYTGKAYELAGSHVLHGNAPGALPRTS